MLVMELVGNDGKAALRLKDEREHFIGRIQQTLFITTEGHESLVLGV